MAATDGAGVGLPATTPPPLAIVPTGGDAEPASHGAATASPVSPSTPAWRQDISRFKAGRKDVPKGAKRGVRQYYEHQNELIGLYEAAEARIERRLRVSSSGEHGANGGTAVVMAPISPAADATAVGAPTSAAAVDVAAVTIGDAAAKSEGAGAGATAVTAPPPTATAHDSNEDDDADSSPAVRFVINASFIGNILLFAIKIFAAAYSGSLAVVGSAIDSSLDLLSGSIIFIAARIASRSNPYRYPVGKTRLEPLAIIVFASVMGVAALQLIVEAIQAIAKGVTEGPPEIKIDAVTYGVLGSVIGVKVVLLILCWGLRHISPSVGALAQDHRNDVVTNSATIVAVALASRFPRVWWLDPAMAIGTGILIVVTWSMTGREFITQLTGKAAEPDQVSVLTYLAMNHDERIEKVDTVRAYYVGTKLLVELDIVLPKAMTLETAHDIGEGLQHVLERQEFVERAFVHLDTEYEHRSSDEHRVL